MEEESPYSPDIAPFTEALEALYIPGNISGRNHFRTQWPAAAYYLFGEVLLAYDAEGGADKTRREALEAEAETRRIALLEALGDVAAKTFSGGGVQRGYVGEIIDSLGAELARYIYSEALIRDVRPVSAPPGDGLTSPLNLAAKRRLVQVEINESKAISYADLVKEEEASLLAASFNASMQGGEE